jgi:plastocyanin
MLLTLAACGGDDAASSTSPAEPTATESATAAPTETAAEITIASFSFSGVTEVPVGTTVTVTNDDSTSHTWTSLDGVFDSGTLAPGASFQFTFDTPGTFAYHCNIHSSMTGSITVTG